MKKIVTWWKKQKIEIKLLSILVSIIAIICASWINLIPSKIEMRTANGYYHFYWKWLGFTFWEKQGNVRL